jgi:hypothetical protein
MHVIVIHNAAHFRSLACGTARLYVVVSPRSVRFSDTSRREETTISQKVVMMVWVAYLILIKGLELYSCTMPFTCCKVLLRRWTNNVR